MNLPRIKNSPGIAIWALHVTVLLLTSGCGAGDRVIPGVPECVSVDLLASDVVCFPMNGTVSQQQFTCTSNISLFSDGGAQCRQQCYQSDPVSNSTITFYTDCTPIDVESCNATAKYIINESCSQNGLQGGLIVSGCLADSWSRKDGIFCNLAECDLGKSLVDIYDKCEFCRWISVFADNCIPENLSNSYSCENVSEEKVSTSRFVCRAIGCSSFGSEGKMTLDSASTISCWDTDWHEQLIR